METRKAVYLITNTLNDKHYVGISHNIRHEWFNIKKKLETKLGFKKMHEDYNMFGPQAFTFEPIFYSESESELLRKESELAYKYDVWSKGYNTEALLNYSHINEDMMAYYKLSFFKMLTTLDDGKYQFERFMEILSLPRNDLEIILREITENEMDFFKKIVILRRPNNSNISQYVEIRTINAD